MLRTRAKHIKSSPHSHFSGATRLPPSCMFVGICINTLLLTLCLFMNNFSMIFFPDLPFFRLFFFSRKKKINTAFQKKKRGGGGEPKESTFRLPRAPGPRVPCHVSPEGQQGGPGPRIPRTLTPRDPGERRGPGRALPLGGGCGSRPGSDIRSVLRLRGGTGRPERGGGRRGLGPRGTAPSV